jgi:iron(II)-dependent oxidoreductase
MMNRPPASIRPAQRGWAYRFFRSLTARRAAAGPAPAPRAPRRSQTLTTSRVRGMARQLVGDDRYVFVLIREAADGIPESEARHAWDAILTQMALIPSGTVPVSLTNGATAPVEIHAFYLDRFAVTNRQYQRFVEAGGYDNLEIWPQEVWPSLMKFVDRTHRPGPRDWENGRFPAGKADHPVVGVCWFEAAAYATWVGKRLPSAAEWQKAAGWPEHFSGGSCNRYPWGDVFEPARANLWSAGLGRTLPVDELASGATPNGIYQMTGNVWEWLHDHLDTIPCRQGETFHAWKPLRRIAGGAFDTYFPAEAVCQFVTGQPELDRRENIGFRCAVAVNRLRSRL